MQMPLTAQDLFKDHSEPVKSPRAEPSVIIAGSSLYNNPDLLSASIVKREPDFINLVSKISEMPDQENLPRDGGIRRRGLRITKTWAWVGSAVALAAGAAGYYFKAQADKSYEEYLDTIVPDQMDRHFNEALKFDKLSSACYISGEAVLVFSLVVFIKTVRTE